MNTTATDFLDTPLLDTTLGSPELESEPTEQIPLVELPAGTIDPRLKLLSHSSRTTLHKCPRKYQLYRLSSDSVALIGEKETEQGVTFAYGSAVGIGVASVLEGKSETQVLLDTFLEWDVDLLDETPRQKKSFWLAMHAVMQFIYMRSTGYLDDYELVIYKGKPAVELSFQVLLPEDYRYRGYVDAVLQHKHTGEVLVLECKTSSGTAQPAYFRNSGQALGYSVVLDVLFPGLSSYTVLYLVYETKSYAYVELPFQKSLLQRALWLQELLIDSQMISLYHSFDTFPMHGENCYDFFKECEYLGLCTLTTENLVKPLDQKMMEKIEEDQESYEFTVDFNDLVLAQIEKGAK